MRIWSLHPQYLDPQGLVALWRETLLAQAVLAGQTKGYTQHPQLQRFKTCAHPVQAVAQYLNGVSAEALKRGYKFDASKIAEHDTIAPLGVNTGQIAFEWQHLVAKLQTRSPELAARWAAVAVPDLHPMFVLQDGPVADWERP